MNGFLVPSKTTNRHKYISILGTFQIECTLFIDSYLFTFHLTYFGFYFISGEVSLENEGYKNDFWL